MKIVHVIPGFLPEHVAGTEVYCWSICKFLLAQGIDTEVVIPGFGQDQNAEYVYDGIRVIKYAEPTKQTRLHISGLALPEGIKAFREYIRGARPSCVHFHGIYAGIGITVQHIAEVKALGIPVIYTMHLPGHVCATETLIYKEKKICDGIIRPVRCASCHLVHQGHSNTVANVMGALSGVLQKTGIDTGYWNSSLGTGLAGANRIADIQKKLDQLAVNCNKVVLYARWFQKIMIANGFPEEKTTYVPPALSFAGEPGHTAPRLAFNFTGSIKLIFIGRLHPLKGVELLLNAIGKLPEGKIELSIYGKGDQAYIDKCHQLSAGRKNIHWRGLLSREDLLSTVGQHDMLCLPSAFSEMSPLVIQEAFGAGIPVLASEVYGNAELIRHDKNGLLFTFKSLDSLQAQLQRLLDEPQLLPALKSGVNPPVLFDEVARRYLEIYNEVGVL
ncbi:glycosyltransferase [Flavitalea sp. BT771]|uniref:glycosyltransferase n=1 Tax=Flavitalea sp. BT771 TaxID=3063329 RepID=UPI0026E373C5|nr:glycosyltransferase [Flavitalea sp. BT771]MDO6434153.1 glycosyltransferase [Flavitalea sp. BT771]MDV6223053.1 glycosyltransferase [Flavitalea sp. BT771]